MKAAYAPVMAVLVISAMYIKLLPVFAQGLPPTNMGKFVHQPGDNQYSDNTQQERHGSAAPAPSVQVRAQPVYSSSYTPTPAPARPDVTLEPIASDEPIPPAGFPPLPNRLDLPVAGGGNSWTGGGSAAPAYSGGNSAAPGMSSGGPPQPTYHQHYGHVPPGAYLNQNQGSTHGYYKAVDPGRAQSPGADYYNANPGQTPGTSPPAYTGASTQNLRSLGREPQLNQGSDQGGAPSAPAPVVVNQSTTQDLSLPEDEFNYRQKKKGPGIGKALTRAIRGPLNSVGGVAGVRF